ncbi:FAD-dependent monooxygenase [Nonomuraea roseoviolacea subsp. roseoviolacea]|uniref:2-polyprenyl-6-methoxyphenol hydroxylase-like FAD-dependent oxidoreductase n=1 Tax=Nonomuraea roseoviolacea subsp. carminata TaxID=160689 RepID=A0ABT1KC10_9ACTN|nr:FAD-dependent monooxygenase [Nonomuraea roseoviolacea]MCP2351540.1 2-polyprenyl-6-methoxyphenol hydroxylase-like FAD-dependent oxidoreductase [Nonomuraea roseoviolacea subsp. carminata]
MRVLIIGGGVAGTVAALAARKAGFEPRLFEAYDESAGLNHGVYLTVAVNGVDALRAVDAHRVVLEAGFRCGRIQFRSGSGKHLGSVPLGPTLEDGAATHTIRRADLYRGLYRLAADRGIPIQHGKRLTGAESLPGGGVRAHFADGTSAEGDVLIGADGVHSATRTAIDPANPGPRYTGLGNTGGFTRTANVDAEPGDYVMIWGRDCFFGYTVAPDGELWWFANPPAGREPSRADLRRLTTADLKARLVELLAVDDSPAAQIVRDTAGDFGLTNQYDLPTVPTWHNGSMVVIGDAAHAVSPSSGQGASLAAEDAVVLARCLRDLPTVPAALARYESLRRERVERIVKWGAGMNNTKKQGLVGRALRDLALPLILRKADDPREMEKMSWMFRHHIDWSHTVRP